MSPEGFQFVDIASLQIPNQGGFYTGEAPEEVLIRAGEAPSGSIWHFLTFSTRVNSRSPNFF